MQYVCYVFGIFKKNDKKIKSNITIFCSTLLKEVRNLNLGLRVSQTLDGVTSQKHMTVIREAIIKS